MNRDSNNYIIMPDVEPVASVMTDSTVVIKVSEALQKSLEEYSITDKPARDYARMNRIIFYK